MKILLIITLLCNALLIYLFYSNKIEEFEYRLCRIRYSKKKETRVKNKKILSFKIIEFIVVSITLWYLMVEIVRKINNSKYVLWSSVVDISDDRSRSLLGVVIILITIFSIVETIMTEVTLRKMNK